MMRVLRRPTFGTGSSLLTGLVSYYKCDEASGDLLDAHGSNNLTDTNTVGTAAGIINTSRAFTLANAEKFTLADNASLSTGNIDFSWFFWARFIETANYPAPITKLNEYQFYINDDGDEMVFYVYDGASDGFVTASSYGPISINTWTAVAGWHDSVANTLNIQINDGPVDSVAHSTGVLDSSDAFEIGVGMDGRIDEVAFAKRIWTAGERTSLFGGVPYPF